MKLLSNGFFKNHFVNIDNNEEIQFTDFDGTDEINVLCDDFDFNINDLRDLIAVDEETGAKIKNVLQNHCITDKEYDTILLNYYVVYSKRKDEFMVLLTVYDLDLENQELEDFLWKFGKEINIVINTDEEKEIFREKLNNSCKHWCYENINDFYNKEYDYYVLEEKKKFLVDKRDVIDNIKELTKNNDWFDYNDLSIAIINMIKDMKEVC